jgi:Mlc titration factor MtfA (ptsG expression regulator)
MFFSWLKNRRRRKVLAEPFPSAWQDVLDRNVRHIALLPDAERVLLHRAVRIFVAEKDFEGCRGMQMTDEVRVTIAALASILVLGMNGFYFDNVQTVLVYPDEFLVPEQRPIADDLVEHGESERLGEAHRHGPVILAWADALDNARRPGFGTNLVFHEFAHQLDMLNGDMDGTPAIDDRNLRLRWAQVMEREYERLCGAADRGKKTLLDPYGATDPAEFFAVVTECFFDLPWELERRHGELYEVLRDYYCQDPARWPRPAAD